MVNGSESEILKPSSNPRSSSHSISHKYSLKRYEYISSPHGYGLNSKADGIFCLAIFIERENSKLSLEVVQAAAEILPTYDSPKCPQRNGNIIVVMVS